MSIRNPRQWICLPATVLKARNELYRIRRVLQEQIHQHLLT